MGQEKGYGEKEKEREKDRMKEEGERYGTDVSQ
jgi:hypothetical protein